MKYITRTLSTPLAYYKKYSIQLQKDQNENAKEMLLKFLMKFPRRRELRYVLTVKVKPQDFLVVACTSFSLAPSHRVSRGLPLLPRRVILP